MYQFLEIPKICPYCNQPTEIIISEANIEKLFCTNPNCNAKLINRLENFFGKKGLDIKGISKATFEKLIDWGWIENIQDVFNLYKHRNEWIKKSGFGITSVDKILKAIEEGKNTTLDKFIAAIGIPLIGQVVAKDLTKYFTTYQEFRNATSFLDIENIGPEMERTLKTFDYTEADNIANILHFQEKENNIIEQVSDSLNNKVIVITGKLQSFKNRDELKQIIIAHGGKVSDSITSKTSMLINNDNMSTSSKNIKAQQLKIPIITETDFIQRYLEN